MQNAALRWNTVGVFGQERLGTYLSIAVHPTNSDEVWLAWVDTGTTNVPTLHVRHSTDRGVTWDANDLRTVASAINPALAITTGGEVGFLYQELATVSGNQRWITHFERTSNSYATFSGDTLATVLAAQPAQAFTPYLGDYVHLLTNGRTFNGIFAAGNLPNNANFPSGVTYQRNANFTTNQLLDATGVNQVAQSIDPFLVRARTGRIIDWCDLLPGRCVIPDFAPDLVRWECLIDPCIVIDPLDRNCLLKWSCPGCEGALCPGLYEITLEGLGPEWHVLLVDPAGDPFAHRIERSEDRVTLRFVPRREDFRDRNIGDYRLVFAADSGAVRSGSQFSVRARLNVSQAPVRGRRPPLR